MALTPAQASASTKILSPIAAGGMGEVYTDRDIRLDGLVAIKTSKTRR
ncbi:MAG: hypothetical protein ABI995_12620 [Acidobacteriota bacterium]